ncbi:MAG: LamG domain-containing protein, partial [Armatimonadetes bacterium]|nr:LamG domain-containing protein [Armatimonadota bacterium]
LVVIPDAPSLDLPEEVTLAFYLKLTGDTGTWQFPVNKYLGHQVRNYGVYIRPDAFAPCFSASFEGADYRHSDVSTSINLNDGNWHHLCATVSVLDQRVTVYVDGRLATQSRSVPGAMLTNDEPLRIGAGTNGIIDEVVVWPRALTAEEVQAVSKGAAAWR